MLARRPADTLFRDALTLMLLAMVVVLTLVLLHINPKSEGENDISTPGDVVIQINWPDGMRDDIDLWVQVPGDVPVGYSNKGGKVANLLRDDLGSTADMTDLNEEFTFTRGVPAGEYTVNIHHYGGVSLNVPARCTVTVSLVARPVLGAAPSVAPFTTDASIAGALNRVSRGRDSQQILSKEVTLDALGRELTCARFTLDADGALVPDSINQTFRPIRAGRVLQ